MSAVKIADKHIIIGRFGRTYGLGGWLRVHSETAEKMVITDYHPWFVEANSGWEEVKITNVKPHGKTLIAHIKNIDNPEEAEAYKGKAIFIMRNQLAKLDKGEYYWTDLEGLTVIARNGKAIGIIQSLMETGSNDVMVVAGKNKRYLIPFFKGEVILNIDLEKKMMTVDWDTEF